MDIMEEMRLDRAQGHVREKLQSDGELEGRERSHCRRRVRVLGNTSVLRNASCVAKQRCVESRNPARSPESAAGPGDSDTHSQLSRETEQGARTMAAVGRLPNAVDETLCDSVVCQHPLCWETMRRLERGLPRLGLRSVPKIPPESEDELPTLSILELPQWNADKVIDVPDLLSRKTTASSQPFETARPSSPQSISMMGSSVEGSLDYLRFIRSRSYSPGTRIHSASLRKVDMMELQQHPSPCDQYPEKTMFIWVPNYQNQRKWQRKREQSTIAAQFVTITDISFQGQPYEQLAGLSTKQKHGQKMKKKVKNKVPTGGQPYTFHARQQQSLRRWKDTTRPMGTELGNQPPGKVMGLLAQPNQSDRAAEQGPRQRHALAKSQPSFSGYVCQGSRKIPAHLMPAPVNKKVTLHNFAEKQQRAPAAGSYGGHYRMDEEYLEAKRMEIVDLETLKRQPYLWKKYFGDNRSASQDKTTNTLSSRTFTDQGTVALPSPVSPTEEECTQRCSNLYGSDFQIFSSRCSSLCDCLESSVIIPEVKSEVKNKPSTVVDNRLLTNAETDTEMNSPLNLPAQPGDEVQNVKWIKEQDLSTATEMGSPLLVHAGSEDQSSLPIAERSEQEGPEAATEMESPLLEQAGSEDQISLPIAERSEQEGPEAATEMGSPLLEQAGSEDQISLPIAERSEQEGPEAATESRLVILEQRNRERSEDHQNGIVVAKSVEEQVTTVPTETASPPVGETDQGGPEV
ncbi:uncharacterized protein [Heptranchias perlo]|uniref:uncharacterized protein n=1 Tax=Heptranchias perlo TaxID=212740 RepID=UPI00355A2AC3